MRTSKGLWFSVLGLMFVAGIAVAIAFDQLSTSPEDLSATISKAGVTTAVITVAGAIANGIFRLLDERRLRDQERRRVFHDVVGAYNAVKAARRGMRALGLANFRQPELGAEAAKELRSTMAGLNDAQLQFEAITREVEQADLFKRKKDVLAQLRTVEDYINKSVLDGWERYGSDAWAGATPNVVESLRLGPFMTEGFKRHVSEPLDVLTEILQDELFGRRTNPRVAMRGFPSYSSEPRPQWRRRMAMRQTRVKWTNRFVDHPWLWPAVTVFVLLAIAVLLAGGCASGLRQPPTGWLPKRSCLRCPRWCGCRRVRRGNYGSSDPYDGDSGPG